MGPDEGRSHQAPRSLSNFASVRERHNAINANLRR